MAYSTADANELTRQINSMFPKKNNTENYYVISERDFKRLKEYDERSVY